MPASVGEIWLMVVFPAVLTLIQMLVPRKTRTIYLWLGFAVLCIFSVGATLYLGQATGLAKALVALSGAIPVVFAALRFALLPSWHRYQDLKALQQLLGAVDWGLKRSQNTDTFEALEKVKTSFSFMGFGFSKYLKATANRDSISGKSEVERSLLWDKIRSIYFVSPRRTLRILLMDPLAHEIEKYSRFLDRKYPQVEDLYFGLDCLKEITHAFGEMVQVRFYPNSLTYKPSFRLFFANDTDLYVSFYQWGTKATDLPYLHLRKRDRTFFFPFQVLFEYLWEHGEVADIESMPFAVTLRDVYTHHPRSIARVRQFIQAQLPSHLSNVPFEQLRIAAAAISGGDSAAAILRCAQSGQYDCIVPVLIGAPTEYLVAGEIVHMNDKLGDFKVRSDTIKRLKQAVEALDTGSTGRCYLLNLVYITAGVRPWAEVFRRMQNLLRFQTGDSELDQALMSPCIPCHVYIHYLRAMLCQRLRIKTMISGDRIFHGQSVKLNQMECILDALERVVKREFGVRFVLPLSATRDNKEIQKLLEAHGISSVTDVDCIFAGQGTVRAASYESMKKGTIEAITQKVEIQIVPILQGTLHELYATAS